MLKEMLFRIKNSVLFSKFFLHKVYILMINKYNLFNDIQFNSTKTIFFYKKNYLKFILKNNILRKALKELIKYPKGVVSLNINNKIDF